jgi:hypothetical protein
MIPANIKLLIENRFGRKILYSKDCEALSISIKRICSEPISATTLKRIFGFAKNIERPRLSTLDTLAKYLNFADWSSLLNATSENEKRLTVLHSDHPHTIQQQLLMMMMTGIIDIKKVEALCIKYGICDEIINFIIDLVMFAGKSKNTLFLKQVFDLPVVYDSIKSNPKLMDIRLYFIGQSVGMALRSDKTMAADLIKIYGTNAVAQVILVEWFVDEDYIDGYYGKLLEAYYKHKPLTNETKIFYCALKYTRALQINDRSKQKYWATKLNKINFSEDYHPIIIGRYLGIVFSEDCDNSFEKDINYFISTRLKSYNYIQKGYCGLFALRYLFENKKKMWFVKLSEIIEKELNKDKLSAKDFWVVKIDNQLLIYFAYTKYLKGNLKMAKKYLNKIDLNLFDVFRYRSLHKDFSDVQTLLKK